MSTPNISVVVPTFNGGQLFRHLCRHLGRIRVEHGIDVLIIDSGSSDDTVRNARDAGLHVHSIAKSEFGHGRTRNLGIQMTSGDVICFLTQDVLPCTPEWPFKFASALRDRSIAGVYGRQVPRDARSMEMFFVSLNYPATPLRFMDRDGVQHPRPGRVLFSNAFSAVSRRVVESIPFIDDAQFSEDQMWAHEALNAGFSIVYEPEVEALHAHAYTAGELFRRSYEVGRALRSRGIAGGGNMSESVRFLASEIRYFIKQGHTHRLPQLLPYEFIRWSGFQVGRRMASGHRDIEVSAT